MQSTKKKRIEILLTCKSILNVLNLCNKNGVFIRNVKIPNLLFYFLYLLSMVYEFVTVILYVIESDMTAQRKSNVMCAAVAILQVILTYISMIKSNKFTMYTIDHIQQIVDKSEFSMKVKLQYLK